MTTDSKSEPDDRDENEGQDDSESSEVRESGGIPAPFLPDDDDDSPLGDTDQHSDA